MPLLDRTVESRQESIEWRKWSWIGKGPRDGNRTTANHHEHSYAICRHPNHEVICADTLVYFFLNDII